MLLWLLLLALAGCTAPRNPESPEEAFGRARTLVRRSRYPEALAAAEAGLRAAASQPNSKTYWRLRLLRAEILLDRGEDRKALASLDHAPAPGQWPEVRARELMLRAMAQFTPGNYRAATALLEEAARLAVSAGDPLLAAEIEMRRGVFLVRLEDLGGAEAALRHAGEALARHGDPYLQARATGNLGFVLLNAARYEECVTWSERAQAQFRKLGAQNLQAQAVGNAGWCYFRLGDLEKAAARFEQARAVFHALGDRTREQLWTGNTGTARLNQGDTAAAVSLYRQALDMARAVDDNKSAADWSSQLAKVMIQLGDLNAAEQHNNEAAALRRRLNQNRALIFCLNNAARIAALRKDYAGAERLFAQAAASPAEDPTPVLEAHAGLARVCAQRGDVPRAVTQYRTTLALVERQRAGLLKVDFKLSYLASLARFYRDYVDFLMGRGRTEAALEAAESSRARLLAERAQAAQTAAHPGGAGRLQRLAEASRAVLLSYWLGSERSFLWVVTPSGVAAHVLPPESAIRLLVENYAALLLEQRDPLQSEHPAGRKLYDLLLAPARISPGSRVIVVPDGPLHALNFETLPVPGAAPHYFIEDAEVAVAPSLALLGAAGADTRAPRGSLLLMGDPAPGMAEFPPLKFASAEIEGVERAFPAARKTVLRGPAARPAAYSGARPESFALIHFVAHAVANSDSPLDSAVILSGPEDQCRLFARDLMKVRLNAEVVTISACRGAGARVYAGEGLVGLSWAFLSAGARNVIAGLWNVDDRSTAGLMERLYLALAAGGRPAEALRKAKLDLLRSRTAFQKPYYWAPFQVYTRAAVPNALARHGPGRPLTSVGNSGCAGGAGGSEGLAKFRSGRGRQAKTWDRQLCWREAQGRAQTTLGTE